MSPGPLMSERRSALSPTSVSMVVDGLVAGMVAWAGSGLPSTFWTLARGGDPLQAVRAAGTLVLSPAAGPTPLLLAGAGAHTVISFGWAMLLALALPRRRAPAVGAAAGLAIAALDLWAVGRHYPALRTLPALPQVADHLAFGAIVGIVIRRRRRGRVSPEGRAPCWRGDRGGGPGR